MIFHSYVTVYQRVTINCATQRTHPISCRDGKLGRSRILAMPQCPSDARPKPVRFQPAIFGMKPASGALKPRNLGVLYCSMEPTMMDLTKRYGWYNWTMKNFGDSMRIFLLSHNQLKKRKDIYNRCRILHFYLLIAIIDRQCGGFWCIWLFTK